VQPLTPNDPRTAGEFTLRARLGAGGMGRVYLGASPAGRAVAIKVVHPELARDEEFLARFRNEVAAARAVSGMYTAPVVASGLDDNPPWLATVFVPGPALDDVVAKHGPLPEAALWRLAAGLAEALAAVHACGVLHRDLKPSNVLMAADGPHVIDFGISRAMEGTHLTATGIVVGTPGYMSPEQAEGREAGTASDVFSMACVIAYAATGKQPFGTGNAATVLFRVVRGEPELTGVPPRLREVLEPCLRKDPGARPLLSVVAAEFSQGARSMADAIESPTAFWPEAVENVIKSSTESRPAVTGLPASPPSGTAAPASPASPPPRSGPSGPAFTPPPSGQVPAAASYTPPPSGQVPPFGQAPAAAPYTPPPSGQVPPFGQVPPSGQLPRTPGGPGTPPPSAYQPPSYMQTPPPASATPPPGHSPQTWRSPGGGTPPPQTPYSPTPFPAAGQAPWQAPGMQAPGMQAQVPQSGAAPPWTGAVGAVGAPGFGHPGIAQPGQGSLHAYRPARRNPARAEVPPRVISALRIMWVGLAATVVNLIVSIVAVVHLDHLATPTPFTAEQNAAYSAEGIVGLFALIAGIIGIVMWTILAVFIRRARKWATIVGTVLFGLQTVCVLFILIGATGAPGVKATSVIVWGLGLAATVMLWGSQARAFYQQFK
jgi:serine/threonine protein kinase